MINKILEQKKERNIVYSLNSNSAGGGGVDGFNGKCLQACCEIIVDNMVDMVSTFFCGHELPRYITCANLVMTQKKRKINTSLKIKAY